MSAVSVHVSISVRVPVSIRMSIPVGMAVRSEASVSIDQLFTGFQVFHDPSAENLPDVDPAIRFHGEVSNEFAIEEVPTSFKNR